MADTGRWAVSALSRENKVDAYLEELLVHKETGQMLIKTPDGNVISYSSLSRFKNHTDMVEVLAANIEAGGYLSQIIPEAIELPDVVPNDINILDTPVTIEGNVKHLLLSVDMDCVEILGLDTLTVIDEPSISIDFKYVDSATTFNVTRLARELNKSLILIPDQDGTGIEITSIKIVGNPANDTKTIRNIVHSILVVISSLS